MANHSKLINGLLANKRQVLIHPTITVWWCRHNNKIPAKSPKSTSHTKLQQLAVLEPVDS
ncbi:UNVERIFIED_CONTAM: hypothetical protein FKN15_019272 [Acipenser sinensis]